MIPGLMLPVLAAAGAAAAAIETVTITVAQDVNDGGEFFYYAYQGFRTANSEDDAYLGASSSFGSRSPTTVSSITVEAAYFEQNGTDFAFEMVMDGDQRASPPFTRLDLVRSGAVEASYYRADATVAYDASRTCTYWRWSVAASLWAAGDSVSVKVY